ncbi:hypothetical protein PbB2_02836 [Candidatus Phycosocius bacilliformis]|uniref:Uncharacterized protein n=1 Tax=Candidatus Phycosocius bacilliformis TaxID=1445552 RepID=A0A2P2EDL3_9PROT|nr:hypothetical protein [Candidatus Phycosocius bacilliformis]GBF59144.1 hypothetical protein PbB2_02836 [Candidatus Phycosocius bacilliformis]
MSYGHQPLTLDTGRDLRDLLANAVRSCSKPLKPTRTEKDVSAIMMWLDIYWDDLSSIDDAIVQSILTGKDTNQSMQALAEKHE